MKEIILIKDGELTLKGLNRRSFEDLLVKSIRRKVKRYGDFEIKIAQSTVMVIPKDDDADIELATESIKKVFGIAAYCRAARAPKDFEEIKKIAGEYLADELQSAKTFKVEAKRSDKKFPMKSPEICMLMGEYLLNKFSNLSVDVHNPDVTVMVEIRDEEAYIHSDQIKGAGGMPSGSGGDAVILISGGLDSPVAAYMMAKRGLRLTAVHFASPPYTSERAELKVKNLLKKVAAFSGNIDMYTVGFTKIQEEIGKNCREDLFTLIMRRFMMKIAERIAKENSCDALITGESLGQVASQTLKALCTTDAVCNIPVFRPLIGMDKEEIIRISREIDTFDISTEPYEDCCTVFTPRHPRTKPKISMLLEEESKLDCDALIEEAVANVRKESIY
jgi:thiamine biosynthesis protein ThiI